MMLRPAREGPPEAGSSRLGKALGWALSSGAALGPDEQVGKPGGRGVAGLFDRGLAARCSRALLQAPLLRLLLRSSVQGATSRCPALGPRVGFGRHPHPHPQGTGDGSAAPGRSFPSL